MNLQTIWAVIASIGFLPDRGNLLGEAILKPNLNVFMQEASPSGLPRARTLAKTGRLPASPERTTSESDGQRPSWVMEIAKSFQSHQ